MPDKTENSNSELEFELRRVEKVKTGVYEKRTRHKDDNGNPLFINRLIFEDSPYLLQHAHNPVNWYAWGNEAFETAEGEDKPIFLSIGYSTCHWCHVMEAESFDNVEVAKILNQSFICIKLDREQYPDIDEIYMTGVQVVTGHGGWPMSNFLLPDGQPFYSGTYFPPQAFMQLLSRIDGVWREKRSDLVESAERISNAIKQVLQGRQAMRSVDMEQISAGADQVLKREDRTAGGLAGAPKFPQEPLLIYFLEGASRTRDLAKAEFLMRALTAMARGGIYDQVAGGFHRYSTDAQWLVPHFEKMLYNQSQLVSAYLGAWRLTGDRFYLRVLRQTADYVVREMQAPQGGFYSATDADSEDQEGLYFIWTMDELRQHLTERELENLTRIYGLTEAGNFEGANILALSGDLFEFAGDQSLDSFEKELDSLLLKLRQIREQKIPPLRDDKLIVAWAADMAASLAWLAHDLNDSAYLDAAKNAVQFMWSHNFEGQESLRRICLNGIVSIPAQLEDYAKFCRALIALFDITNDPDYLNKAAELTDQAVSLLWNEEDGGFYLSQQLEEGPSLARSTNATDSATLSATGVMLDCLVALTKRRQLIQYPHTGNEFSYSEKVQQCINALSGALVEHPAGHTSVIRAINHFQQGSTEPIQFAAEGLLRVEARRFDAGLDRTVDTNVEIGLSLAISAGYHISAMKDEASGKRPLEVSLSDNEPHWEIERIEGLLEPSENEYQGTVKLMLILKRRDLPSDLLANSVGLTVTVQLCNESLCLPTETLSFRI